MSGITIVGLLLAIVSSDGVSGTPDRGRVIAPQLDVFLAPDGTSYSVGQLVRGDEVRVRGAEPGGWLAIQPPPGSFLWVEERDIDRHSASIAFVVAKQAMARAGRARTRMPGPPAWQLTEGDVVRLLDGPALTLRQAGSRRVWLPMAPPDELVAYVRADGVRQRFASPQVSLASEQASPESVPALAVDATAIVATGPRPPTGSLDPAESARFDQIDAIHRLILRSPIASWQLDRVRNGYEELLESARSPVAAAALRSRIHQVEIQSATAVAARRVDGLLQRARAWEPPHDFQRGPDTQQAETEAESRRPFDADGMLQASSKLAGGEKVCALIGTDGLTIAYLRLPIGVAADRLLGQRVGVYGERHYDETLRAVVIHVRDLVPLGPFVPGRLDATGRR